MNSKETCPKCGKTTWGRSDCRGCLDTEIAELKVELTANFQAAQAKYEIERLKQIIESVRILAESLRPDLGSEPAWRDAWVVWEANKGRER